VDGDGYCIKGTDQISIEKVAIPLFKIRLFPMQTDLVSAILASLFRDAFYCVEAVQRRLLRFR
jgi:hypothetical protein